MKNVLLDGGVILIVWITLLWFGVVSEAKRDMNNPPDINPNLPTQSLSIGETGAGG